MKDKISNERKGVRKRKEKSENGWGGMSKQRRELENVYIVVSLIPLKGTHHIIASRRTLKLEGVEGKEKRFRVAKVVLNRKKKDRMGVSISPSSWKNKHRRSRV